MSNHNHNHWAGNERHSRHQSEHYHEFSGYGSTAASKPRDHSGWSSREPSEEDPIPSGRFIRSRQNAPERKDLDREDRYYKNMSPGFDGIECLEQRNCSHTPRNDHHALRYMGRGRSRSRSLSRSRGRSRSRSLSRGGRVWSRSRSRSRSDNAKGRTRSWTPSRDYRRQSYGWSDRKGLSDKSSIVCWDFPTGNCRRGSQCRFLHPDGRDRNFIEDEISESFKRRSDHERIPYCSYNSRGHGFDSRDDVLDTQFVKRIRSTVPCRNLLRGGCRWGDNCGFSHHFASDDDLRRNGSFEDYQREANTRRMPLCKYFAAGRCARDDCRFSHDEVKLSDLGISHSEVTDTRDLHDKRRLWNVPTWDDSIILSPDDTLNRVDDDKWDHTMENNGKSWGLRGCTENTVNRDRKPSPWGSSGYGREMIGTTEYIAKHNMSNEQDHLMLHRSHLKVPRRGSSSHGGDIIDTTEPIAKDNMSDEQDNVILHGSQLNGGISNVQQQHQIKQENNIPTFSMNALQRDICQVSHYQRRLENNEPTFSMNALQPEASHYQRRLENNVSTFSTNALQPDVSQASHYQRRLDHSESTFSTNSLQAEASHYRRRLENNDSAFSTNALQPEVSKTSHYQRRLENNEPLFSTNSSQQDISLASCYQRKENIEPTFSLNSLQQDVSQVSHYQRRLENNTENLLGTGVIDQVEHSKPTLSICFSREDSNQNVESIFPGSSNETGKEQNNHIPNRSNEFSTDLNGFDTPTVSPTGLRSQTQYHQEGVQVQPPSMLEKSRHVFPRLLNAQTTNTPVMIASQPVAPLTNPTLSFTNDQAQSYPGKEGSNLHGVTAPSLHSTSEKGYPFVSTVNAQLNSVNSMENCLDSTGLNNLGLTGIVKPSKQMQVEFFSLPSLDMKLEHTQVKQQEVVAKPEVSEMIGVERKSLEEKKIPDIVDDSGKVEGSGAIKDEKGMRMFKNALAEFVKEALKPKWKEGKMSRDVHKTIVKKVVDKVINAIQADQVPKTQDKVDLYLLNSKTKINKLVQAYIHRCPKDSQNQ